LKNQPKIWLAYFCNLKKMPKENKWRNFAQSGHPAFLRGMFFAAEFLAEPLR
jgi:hypothetical protein